MMIKTMIVNNNNDILPSTKYDNDKNIDHGTANNNNSVITVN